MGDKVRFIGWAEVPPARWLRQWASLYPVLAGYDDSEYYSLIEIHNALSGTDFERIGRWKDAAWTDARWKPNVASVAYDIWMQAAKELPKCPREEEVFPFLNDWSERTYKDEYKSGFVRSKRFGLSRATTLLHFISGGRFPIFDSRVVAAVSRLFDDPAEYSLPWYVDSYRRIFSELVAACDCSADPRPLDKALFCYGVVFAKAAPPI